MDPLAFYARSTACSSLSESTNPSMQVVRKTPMIFQCQPSAHSIPINLSLGALKNRPVSNVVSKLDRKEALSINVLPAATIHPKQPWRFDQVLDACVMALLLPIPYHTAPMSLLSDKLLVKCPCLHQPPGPHGHQR
jgi:hypothetical protein